MAYNSYVTGTIEPTRDLVELLEFLDDWNFVVDDKDGWLEHGVSGHATGFVVERDRLRDVEGAVKTYGFDATFIEALVAASEEGLINYAYLAREGEERDDQESYEYIDGQWKTAICLIFQVPLGTENKARQIIIEAGNAALGAM